MRPITLTIEGLRSFRSSERINFAGRNHIAIVGDTGAGKSSILEAMTYALYGRTTFAGRGNQGLINDTSTHLRVVFRFQVSGASWEVVRSVKRRKKGDLAPQEAKLTPIGHDDAPVEQVRRVNERVEELLGLDCEAFLRTVVLPQGRFARLLVEDEPRDRSAILRQVWRTDELEAAGEAAGAALRVAEQVRIRLEEAASGYPDDPEGHLEALQGSLAKASDEATAATTTESEAEAAREATRSAERQAKTADDVLKRLDAVDFETVEIRLAPLADLAREFDDQDAKLGQQREQLERERADIPSDDGPTGEEVAAALTTLRSLDTLVASTEKTAADLRVSVETASKKRVEAEGLEKRAGDAKTRSESHAGARPPLDEAVQNTRERLHEVEQSYARSKDRETDLHEAKKLVEKRRTEEAGCAEAFEEAKEQESRTTREAAEAGEHLATARRSDSAATAARELHPGDSCPVCRRDLPADWEAPADAGLSKAERIAREAHEAARAASRKVTRLETEIRGIRGKVSEAKADVAACERNFREAREKLARLAILDPGSSLPERGQVLVPLAAACKEAEAALAEHDHEAKRLRDDATKQNTEAQLRRQDAGNADRTAARSRRTASDRLEDLKTALRAIPDPFRPDLPLPMDAAEIHEVDIGPIARQTESAEAREGVLKERRRELDRLSARIRETETSQTALATRRADEIENPLGDLARQLRKHRDVLVESVSQLRLEGEIPHAPAAEARAFQLHARDLRTSATEVASAAQQQSQEAAGKTDTARAQLKAIGERLGESVDAGDPDAVLGRARARAEAARFRKRTARDEAERFATIASDVRRLVTLLSEAREKEYALRDLSEALKDGRFPKWLTLRRSKRLLVHASRMLEEVSGGRYSFVDPQETDEQWRVLDRDSNQPRTPASLSGGEQFLASLSLALGMVEMMARSGGRLESLFLDEGFGSLDSRNLDAAIQALESVAARGRMVAVISHVRAVAEQIVHVLAVSREATGSRAVWLSDRQREQLAASHLGLETMSVSGPGEKSALGGLLD